MELFDLQPLNICSHVFKLASLEHATNCKEDEEEGKVCSKRNVVVFLAIFATRPVFDFYARTSFIIDALNIAARVGAVGVLIAYRYNIGSLSQTRLAQ